MESKGKHNPHPKPRYRIRWTVRPSPNMDGVTYMDLPDSHYIINVYDIRYHYWFSSDWTIKKPAIYDCVEHVWTQHYRA